ncbi:MAG: C4-dicarboxylate transporter [Burkholderiaceae bacterium]|nr:C4-dicarboxylate transporter [Burkholderiaceae bacterium]
MTPNTLWKQLHVQVLAAIVAGFLLGHFFPEFATLMKPFGDGFIRLIKMVVPPLIFCTVVVGIAGMTDLKQVGRTGGYALLFFELVTTLALIAGMVVADGLQLGSGMHIDPTSIDTHSVAGYAASKAQSFSAFLLSMIPNSAIEAFAKGDILQVLLFSILFGFALNRCGEKCAAMFTLVETTEHVLFSIIRIIMKLAPLGAFGAIAFTIGKHGLATMLPLGKLLLMFYLTCFGFVVIVLALVARLHGFGLWPLLRYLHEEFLVVLGTSSSDAVLPNVMTKMEALGIEKHAVALVLPTGFSFNMIGTSIYLSMAAVFIAQATDTPMNLWQQLALLGVLMLTSKGARGVTGSGFIVLAATLSAVDIVPVSGLALVFGIDHFMSLGRALTNLAGNCVAAVVVAKWAGDLDQEQLKSQLKRPAA